jgi:hypothetical protein
VPSILKLALALLSLDESRRVKRISAEKFSRVSLVILHGKRSNQRCGSERSDIWASSTFDPRGAIGQSNDLFKVSTTSGAIEAGTKQKRSLRQSRFGKFQTISPSLTSARYIQGNSDDASL